MLGLALSGLEVGDVFSGSRRQGAQTTPTTDLQRWRSLSNVVTLPFLGYKDSKVLLTVTVTSRRKLTGNGVFAREEDQWLNNLVVKDALDLLQVESTLLHNPA